METIEIVIYLGIALAAGALIIAFLASQNAQSLQDPIYDLLGLNPQEQGSQRVSAEEFPPALYAFWQGCGFGIENRTAVFSVQPPPDSLFLQDVFTQYTQINLCRTISSETFNCGRGESINLTNSTTMDPIPQEDYEDAEWSLPATIVVRCDTTRRQLEVFI